MAKPLESSPASPVKENTPGLELLELEPGEGWSGASGVVRGLRRTCCAATVVAMWWSCKTEVLHLIMKFCSWILDVPAGGALVSGLVFFFASLDKKSRTWFFATPKKLKKEVSEWAYLQKCKFTFLLSWLKTKSSRCSNAFPLSINN